MSWKHRFCGWSTSIANGRKVGLRGWALPHPLEDWGSSEWRESHLSTKIPFVVIGVNGKDKKIIDSSDRDAERQDCEAAGVVMRCITPCSYDSRAYDGDMPSNGKSATSGKPTKDSIPPSSLSSSTPNYPLHATLAAVHQGPFVGSFGQIFPES